MKFWQIVGGTALSLTLAGCASQPAQPPLPPPGNGAPSTAAIQQPSVKGTISIDSRVALPPDSVLTVTLADASIADTPSKVVAQSVAYTQGHQAPFPFVLPYSPNDVQPKSRVLLSAVIADKQGHFLFQTEQPTPAVTNGAGTQFDLVLKPVEARAVPTKPSTLGPLDTSPNSPMPTGINPAPTPMP